VRHFALSTNLAITRYISLRCPRCNICCFCNLNALFTVYFVSYISSKFLAHATYDGGRNPVVLSCDTICTSGFVDDVMIARNTGNGQEEAKRKRRILKVNRQTAARV